jgi:hypothetical protein
MGNYIVTTIHAAMYTVSPTRVVNIVEWLKMHSEVTIVKAL